MLQNNAFNAVFDGHLMLAVEDVMPTLIAACPSFAKPWTELQADPPCEEGYLEIAEFARHLVSLVSAGEIDSMPEVFSAVERLYLEGDDHVETLLTVGLLEEIQNIAPGQQALVRGTLPEPPQGVCWFYGTPKVESC